MKKKDKWDKIIHETYEMLFKAAEPSVDFNVLLENSTINSEGKKDVCFMNYEIDDDVMDSIVKIQIKKYKMSKFEERNFSVAIYLGCSPKSKIK